MVTKYCPRCKGALLVDPSSITIECGYCNNSFSFSKLLDDQNDSPKSKGSAISASAVAQLIDSPDAGLVYIRNRFDNTDWEAYCESTEVIIPELEEMVEKSKIKFGATATAWTLDFESVSFPLNKKLEGLTNLANKIAKARADGDSVVYEQTFDLYKTIVDNLCDEKDVLIKRLENAVKYAAKFMSDEAALANMNATLASVKAKLDAIKSVKEPYEIPEVRAAQDKIDAEKIKEFAARGLAVKDIYNDAAKLIENKVFDRNEVIRRLSSIRGYSDVNEKINELNKYYEFNNEYYNFCGKSFIFKVKSKDPLFDPTALSKKNEKKEKAKKEEPNEQQYTGDVLQLFEVIDGKPAKDPILEDITQIITVYGTRLYYVKLDSSLCYFDIETKREFELDKGKVGYYEFKRNSEGRIVLNFNSDRTAFYVRKRLELEVLKKGCIQKLLNKQDEALERRNNFSLLEVSLVSDAAKIVVKEMIDITEVYGTNVFYLKAEELSLEELKAKKKAPSKETEATDVEEEDDDEDNFTKEFRVYNMTSGEDRSLLDKDCAPHTVVDGKIIFSRYSPNAYNIDLYVYDPVEEKETLIEKNVRDFTDIIKGRIFYTVGNKDYCPMFSNNLEGTDRIEIMQNAEKIAAVLAGWIYIIKKIGNYTVLMRVSTDGTTRQVVCYDFGIDVKVTDLYIYYISTNGALRVARSDGSENTLIADNISASSVIVDKEYIYYLRKELVDNKIMEASLYRMDLDGHNVCKVLFDVNAIDEYDKNTIMVKRSEIALFEITIPVDAKNTKTERQEMLLTHYCKFNKTTGNIETLLTMGLPDENEYEFKGCFGLGKKKKFNSTYKQIPRKVTLKRANVAKAGSIFGEQAAEQGVATVDPIDKLNNLGGCGAGCASILSSLSKIGKK